MLGGLGEGHHVLAAESGGGFFSIGVWLFAILGCVIVLFIYGLLTRRRS